MKAKVYEKLTCPRSISHEAVTCEVPLNGNSCGVNVVLNTRRTTWECNADRSIGRRTVHSGRATVVRGRIYYPVVLYYKTRTLSVRRIVSMVQRQLKRRFVYWNSNDVCWIKWNWMNTNKIESPFTITNNDSHTITITIITAPIIATTMITRATRRRVSYKWRKICRNILVITILTLKM